MASVPLVAATSWGQQVAAAGMRIQGRMQCLHQNDQQPDPLAAVRDELDEARRVARARPHWYQRLGEWWSGRRIETAWAHIREAELLLVACGKDDPRFQQINRNHAAVDAASLPVDDPARVEFEKLTPAPPVSPTPPQSPPKTAVQPKNSPHPKRAPHPKAPPIIDPVPTIQAVLEASFRHRNAYHGAARALRNRLIVVTLLVVAIAAGLVVTQWAIPQAHVLPRPGDDRSARWVTMLLVMLFGALGALITAIPVMAALPRVASPYNFPLQQSLMKIAVGTLTGLVGVVVIGLPAASSGDTSSFSALVGAAIVFGAGQQAVTRFLDTRAQQVVDAMPTLKPAAG